MSSFGRGARAARNQNVPRFPIRLLASAALLATAALAGVGLGAAPASAAATYVFTLTKTASVTSYSSAGTVITYSYTVTNTGSGTLSNIVVTDPMPGLSAINCGGNSNVIASLAPSSSVTCTATYTVTQADMDAGSITNNSEASADSPVGGTKVETSLTIPAVQVPQLQLVKSASVQGFSQPGTTITYSFTVTNTGNVTLSPVIVTDPLPGLSAINCGSNTNVIPSLAPGQSVTCTATYVTTAADVQSGHVDNTAMATGDSPTDTRVTSNSQDVVPLDGQPFSCTNPGAYLSQSNSSLLPPTAAIQLYYSQVFFNSYTFPTLGSPRTPTYNALGYDPINNYLYSSVVYPSADELLRIDAAGNYTVAGPVSPVSGSFNWTVNGPDVGAFDSSGNYWFAQSAKSTAWEIPAANFVSGPPYKAVAWPMKSAFNAADWTFTPSTVSGINGFLWGLHGGLIYRVELVNSGPLPVATFTPPPTIPAGTSAGADWTYGNGNVGFDSNQTGGVFQVAIASPAANPPTFTGYPSYVGPVAGTINDGAACAGKPVDLGIVKSGPATVPANGTVTWTLKVTNYGPGNSSGYTVTDPVPAGIVGASTPTPGCTVTSGVLQCSEGILDAGNSFTILLTGTLAAGCVTNTASVTGNELDPNPKNNTSSVTTCVGPTLTMNKSANVTSFSATGVVITYSYTVTNNGPYPLYNVTVTDPMAGLSPINCGGNSNVIPVLAPSASVTCTATYVTTLADLNAGDVHNTGTATAQTPVGPLTASSSVTVPAEQLPGIQLVKSANVDDFTQVGQVITYSFVVTNTGNVTLTNVTVTDPLAGLSAINCGSNTNVIPILAPGQSVTCTATYTVTSLSMKDLVNTATATGASPTDTSVSSSSTVTIPNDSKSEPWNCQLTNSTDFLSQGTSSAGPPTSPTQLYGTTSNIWTYGAIGPTAVPTYNALGFDTSDHYLYATDVAPTSPAKFVRIGSGGVVVSSRSIGAPYVAKSGPDVGAFDPSGNYWFTTSNTGTAWRIPAAQVVGSGPIVPVPTTERNLAFAPADWSWVDGAFWGASGKYLYRMTTGGVVSRYAAPAQLAAVGGVDPTFGAAWTFGNGDLGVSNNTTGKIFMIRIAGSGPTIGWVTTFPGPVTASVNDGTSCIGLDVDLGIQKTGPALVLPGGTITWTLKITNHGPGNSSGWVVDDPFPAGVTNVTALSAGCTVLATEVQCQGGVLNVGQSVTVAISARAPSGAGECVENQASVTGADLDPVSSNNSSSVRTCTTKWIRVIKTSPLTNFATVGAVVPYSFTVSDVAPKSSDAAVQAAETLHDVTVVDTLAGVSEVRCAGGMNVVATLAPGQSVACTATLVASSADLAAGDIANVAYATAYDGTGQLLTSANSKVVVPRGVHVVTSALPTATEATAYTAKLVASGGATPYRWTVVGKLPSGLALTSAGVLSGKAKASGLFAVTFRVASAKTKSSPAGSATVTLYLTIAPRK